MDELNLNIRESVMKQLGRTDKEIEEEEAEAESRRLKTSQVFNKSVALLTSKNFNSLRDSIGPDCSGL